MLSLHFAFSNWLCSSFYLIQSIFIYRHCIETAKYLRDALHGAGVSCRLNDLSSTVVLERPIDDAFVKRWQLACEEDIAHVVVMPNVTRNKIDLFVQDLKESMHEHGRTGPARPNSPLTLLESDAWDTSL